MHRREFLVSSVAAGAGLSLAPGSVAAGLSGDRVRVGIVGAGVRGKQLAEAMQSVGAFEITAVCDVLPFRLEESAPLVGPGAARYADHRALLDDRNVDAVIVATHFSEHQRVVLDALDAGKHLYCEKTMIKGIRETGAVVRAAAARPEQIFQTGFQYRSSSLYRRAADMIKSGAIGAVAAVNCQWNRNGNWRRPVPDPSLERQINWRMYREYSSGLAAELSAHQMDFCNSIDGSQVVDIQGAGGIAYWKDGRETYDNINLIVRFESGLTATFASQTTNSLDGYRIAVLGKKGSIILTSRRGWLIPEDKDATLPDGVDLVSGASVYAGGGRSYDNANSSAARAIKAPDTDPTPQALADFADALAAGRQPESNVRTGARVSVMVQLALDAMDNSAVMAWKPDYDFAVPAAEPGKS